MQTQAFIDAFPTKLILKRPVVASDGAGGQTLDEANPTVLEPQKLRIVFQRSPIPIVTEDGRDVEVDRVIVGMPDLDIAIGDEYTTDEGEFEVISVERVPWKTESAVAVKGELKTSA
jgi:hypothetical protein